MVRFAAASMALAAPLFMGGNAFADEEDSAWTGNAVPATVDTRADSFDRSLDLPSDRCDPRQCHSCCDDGRCHKCPPVKGATGPTGPAGPSQSLDSAQANNNYFTVLVPSSGGLFVRDSSKTPPWQDLTSLVPEGETVVAATIVDQGEPPSNDVHISILTADGDIYQTACVVTGDYTWPDNCTAFTNNTPPDN